MEALLLVAAEHDGPTMFARIAIMRALHRERPSPATETGQGLPGHSVIKAAL
jgi:hypothetical protein